MTYELKSIDLKYILRAAHSHEAINIGEDFFILNVLSGQDLGFLNEPFKANAYFAVYCKEGNVEVELNLKKYTLSPGMIMISLPDQIIRVVNPVRHGYSNGHFVAIGLSRSFLMSLNLDFKQIFDDHLFVLSDPFFALEEEERGLFAKYIYLLKDVLDLDISGKEYIESTLISSLFYTLGGIVDKKAARSTKEETGPQNRLKRLFESFMRLVSEYHTSERGMSFYAEKLGLTPKYLSKLIKQVSGRSAPEWIDDFVIVEAKNMLKYSGDSIKEIVYKLHFPNPSVFYKYFKAHTGMTPSQYRGEGLINN